MRALMKTYNTTDLRPIYFKFLTSSWDQRKCPCVHFHFLYICWTQNSTQCDTHNHTYVHTHVGTYICFARTLAPRLFFFLFEFNITEFLQFTAFWLKLFMAHLWWSCDKQKWKYFILNNWILGQGRNLMSSWTSIRVINVFFLFLCIQ